MTTPARAPRLALRLLSVLVFVGVAVRGAPARANGGAAELIAAAAPEVQAALAGDGSLAARGALEKVLAAGRLGKDRLAEAFSHREFGPHAVTTLVALAAVQGINGANETFARLARDKTESGNRGPAFEIQVAAALIAGGHQVVQIGGDKDGNEVDAVLADGTIVEVKNDAPDDETTLSPSLADKAEKQLVLRSKYGDKVMLVTNEPLSQEQAARFRKKLGPTARAMVLDERGLRVHLDQEPESNAQKVKRLALARLRPTMRSARNSIRQTLRTFRQQRVVRSANRSQARATRRAARRTARRH